MVGIGPSNRFRFEKSLTQTTGLISSTGRVEKQKESHSSQRDLRVTTTGCTTQLQESGEKSNLNITGEKWTF